jgi:MarR family transcriptional regulator, organic hydroperoxide resistance regulator
MEINQGNFLYALNKIRQRLFAFLEAELAKKNVHDIPPSYGDVLFVLERKGALTVQEIARYAVKDKSTVSSVVKRLEESGYVIKEKGGDDGRFVRIKPTGKAKRLRPVFRVISGDMNARLFKGLSAGEKITLFRLMEKVYKNIY